MTAAPIKTRTRRPRKAAPAVQEPMVAVDDGRPVDHNGVPVVREETFGNLPSGVKFRVSRLHLADGALAYACRDCTFTGDTRTVVQQHRNAEHGVHFGHKAPRVSYPRRENAVLGDLVLPPRANGESPPDHIMQMTFAEVLALMPSIGAITAYTEGLQQTLNELSAALQLCKDEIKNNEHKVAAYESLQEQIADLRAKVRNVGSYDDMKAELLQLREFKKKTIARFKSLGFVLAEEEE